MKILFIWLFSILIFVFNLNAQSTKFYSSLVQDKHGAYYLFSSNKCAYTIKVEADSIWPTESKGTVNVDKNILQILSIPIPYKIDTTISAIRNLLKDHMNSEVDYIKNECKQNISDIHSDFISLNGKTFLYWEYNMPGDNKRVLSQQYITTTCFDQVVVMNAPVEKSEDNNLVKQFLLTVAQTIKTYNKPIKPEDFEKQMGN